MTASVADRTRQRGPNPRPLMPASTRQRTVRQPASLSLPCFDPSIQEVTFCNGAEDGLKSGFISYYFGLSKGPAPLP